jgi:hypothetical protein
VRSSTAEAKLSSDAFLGSAKKALSFAWGADQSIIHTGEAEDIAILSLECVIELASCYNLNLCLYHSLADTEVKCYFTSCAALTKAQVSP